VPAVSLEFWEGVLGSVKGYWGTEVQEMSKETHCLEVDRHAAAESDLQKQYSKKSYETVFLHVDKLEIGTWKKDCATGRFGRVQAPPSALAASAASIYLVAG